MYGIHRSTISVFAVLALCVSLAPEARAQRARAAAAPTRADVERLEKKIEEQQKRIDRLIKLQIQYLQALTALSDGSPLPPVSDAAPTDAKPAATAAAATAEPKAKPPEPKPRPVAAQAVVRKAPAFGNIVGKVTGAADAVIYVDDIVVATRATATMKQENKTFTPGLLIVQKGTTVQFPNLDAFFHNVFSVTPDNSFDLGSYRQGETKAVTMTKPGVVSVYCNMHPQMVGHILVVPNGNYVRAGSDGFFRIQNVPAGRHRVVAWAPDAKAVAAETEVNEGEPVTVELELKKGHRGPHLKKDGLPYGSYEK